MTTDYTESYARTAEHELSRLADLSAELGVTNDPRATVIVHGMAALTNALLSLDEAVRSGAVDVGNAVCGADSHLCESIEILTRVAGTGREVSGAVLRRPWWHGASREDRAAYRAAREHLEFVSKRDREETEEYFAANDALVAAMERLPWWQR